MTRYGADWTLDSLEKHRPDAVYLPFAAFGAASPHQPLTADLLISEAFARAISGRIGAFLLPVQPFATRYGQHGRQRLGIDADLMYDMTLDLAQEIRRQGFKRLVIQETCCGKSILYSLQRHLNAQAILQAILVNPRNLAAKELTDRHGQALRQEEIDCALLLAATDKNEADPDHGPADLLFAAGVQAAAREIEAAFAFMDEIGGYA